MKKVQKNNIDFFNTESESIFNNPITKFYHMAFIGKTDEEFVDYIINNAGIDKNCKVLDMGCGSGYLVNQLSKLCDAEGITNSPKNLQVCKDLYPKNEFMLGEMESYKGELKSHILTLESFSYNDIDKCFKNLYNNLKPGGILFMKEWCRVEEETEENKENCKALEETFYYSPQKLSTLKRAAIKNKFRLIDEKNLEKEINSDPYVATLPYHNESVRNFIFPHDVETVIPIQLKFRK